LAAITALAPGKTVPIGVLRAGREIGLTVTVGRRRAPGGAQ
jgi:S1-C subfamily serine protease